MFLLFSLFDSVASDLHHPFSYFIFLKVSSYPIDLCLPQIVVCAIFLKSKLVVFIVIVGKSVADVIVSWNIIFTASFNENLESIF